MPTVRRQIAIYLAVTFAVSWALMGYIVYRGGMANAGNWILLTMWVPGLTMFGLHAHKVVRATSVGWRIGAAKYWALSIIVPLVIAAVAYAVSWATGVSAFRMPPADMLERNNMGSALELVVKLYPLSLAIGFFGALGEEFGWRGFLLPKMVEAGVKRPLIMSSLIWGAWHLPLVLFAGYASSNLPAVSAVLLMITALFAGIIVGWLRLASGSVWVATMYHAAHNLFLQTAFEVFNAPGELSPLLSGESGVIPNTVFATVVLAGWWFITRKAKA